MLFWKDRNQIMFSKMTKTTSWNNYWRCVSGPSYSWPLHNVHRMGQYGRGIYVLKRGEQNILFFCTIIQCTLHVTSKLSVFQPNCQFTPITPEHGSYLACVQWVCAYGTDSCSVSSRASLIVADNDTVLSGWSHRLTLTAIYLSIYLSIPLMFCYHLCC